MRNDPLPLLPDGKVQFDDIQNKLNRLRLFSIRNSKTLREDDKIYGMSSKGVIT